MTMTAAEIFEAVAGPVDGLRVEAYDGSATGDPGGRVLRLRSPRALHYLLTSPSSELGFAPRVGVDEGLRRSLLWYAANRAAAEA